MSSNTSRFEPHPGFYRLFIRRIFDAYVLWPFDENIFFEFVTRVNTRDFMVSKYSKASFYAIIVSWKNVA